MVGWSVGWWVGGWVSVLRGKFGDSKSVGPRDRHQRFTIIACSGVYVSILALFCKDGQVK